MSKLRSVIAAFTFLFCTFNNAFAYGGITIQGTRLIYPLDERQLTFSVANTSSKDSFLVQSWVENQAGEKVKDLIVVPPLYLAGPNDENILRLILMNRNLPNDRESLYYFVAKGIPSIDKKSQQKNNIKIALASRIKLFIRPSGLTPSPARAPEKLIFIKNKTGVVIKNPTPYFLTLVNIKYGTKNIESLMIKPFSQEIIPVQKTTSSVISFSTINDYGANTSPLKAKVS
ncbi:fimbrial biogenesis chaperone [Pantoea ananatis]|jgi:fimbrial chaperone protein|uniref:fimbrial biogenesis chaperone n=1 Tax=Pantoea ananas TaxID=553 RepID=UPI000D5FA8DA|nr:fimbria/pilus periplasmic chaperone [Pantoea ananatis]MCV3299270.1 fimbria/pilus periplasmic chaperone [Pantoea ananatis]PVY81913.1 fimbrial chaperone protein [Pantoea ananatis]